MNKDQYEELLSEIESAYAKSDIQGHEPKWWYGVVATRIIPRRPLIVGFNWGVSEDHFRPNRKDFPTATLVEQMAKPKELGSLVRMRRFLTDYVTEAPPEEIGQTNLYFFRTRHAAQLTQNDRRLCVSIFLRLLEVAKPTLIIALSNSVSSALAAIDGFGEGLQTKGFELNSRGQPFQAIRGAYATAGACGRWIAVPHPATPCLGAVRDAVWSYCLPRTQD